MTTRSRSLRELDDTVDTALQAAARRGVPQPVRLAERPLKEMDLDMLRGIAPFSLFEMDDGTFGYTLGTHVVSMRRLTEDEEAERVGYFGEERRRVKVGERPASARKAHERSPVPPPGGTSLGAREGLFGGGGGPRGRKMAKAGAPPPGAPGGRPSNGSSKRGSVSAR